MICLATCRNPITNMYADDTNITAYHTNINKVEDSLDKDLDILFRWLQGNRLNVACVQPEFKGGNVSLRIREQYRVRSIF